MKGNRIQSAYSLYKKYKSKYITWLVTGRHYASPIDPFKLLRISPDSIRVYQRNSSRIQQYDFSISEVRSGDWDKQVDEFREIDYYSSFVDHFEYDVPWKQTEWVQRVFDEIESGIPIRNCTTEKEFLDHCSEIDELYERIRTEGYKTQRELLRETPSDKFNRRWAYYCPNLHEITVNIGRDGEFIFEDGWRRFVIADLLNISTVPVRVNLRHSAWQRRRDAISRQRESEIDYQHPDLLGLRQGSEDQFQQKRQSGHLP